MYLSGEGAKFSMAVLVGQTDRFTVEFWFKPNITMAGGLNCLIETKTAGNLTCTIPNPGENPTG